MAAAYDAIFDSSKTAWTRYWVFGSGFRGRPQQNACLRGTAFFCVPPIRKQRDRQAAPLTVGPFNALGFSLAGC